LGPTISLVIQPILFTMHLLHDGRNRRVNPIAERIFSFLLCRVLNGYNPAMSSITFTILPPPEILKKDVECFRVATYTEEEELAVRVCPNGFPGIVFQHHAERSVIKNIVTQSGRVVYTPTLFMHGQVTELTV